MKTYGNSLRSRWYLFLVGYLCCYTSILAATYSGHIIFRNQSASTAACSISEYYSGSPSGIASSGSLTAGSSITNNCNADMPCGGAPNISYTYRWYDPANNNTLATGDPSMCGISSNNWTVTVTYSGPSGPTYTVCTNSYTAYNQTQQDQVWKAVYTDSSGGILGYDFFTVPANSGVTYSGGTSSTNGVGYAYMDIYQPVWDFGENGGGLRFDLKAHLTANCTTGTTPGPNPNPPGTGDPGGGGNPSPSYPGSGPNGDTNNVGKDPQLGSILQVLQDIATRVSTWKKQDDQSAILRDISTNTLKFTTNVHDALNGTLLTNLNAGLTNGLLTNLFDIKTNTATTASGVLAMATNMSKLYTALTNALDGGTNGVIDNSDAVTAGYNAASSTSNSIMSWIPTLPTFSGEAFDSSWTLHSSIGGATWTLDLNPSHNNFVWPMMQWIRQVLAWASCALLVWYCYKATDEKVASSFLIPIKGTTQQGLWQHLSNADPNQRVIGAVWAAWQKLIGFGVALTLIVTLALIPALLTTLWANTGILNTFVSQMPLASTVPGVRQAFQLINAMLPIEVWLAHLTIYIGYRVSLTAVYFVVGSIVRYLIL